MAYAQRPRYGGPQRPNYEHQQASYASSAQPYAAEYNYTDDTQGGSYNDDHQRGQYSHPYGQQGAGYGNDQEWYDGGAQYGNGGEFGGRGQQRGVRQPMQQPQSRPSKTEGYANSDPRSRGLPQSKSRFPPRDQYEQQDPGYQSSQLRDASRLEQPCLLEQDSWQRNCGYGHEDPSYASQDNWTPIKQEYPSLPNNEPNGDHISPQYGGYQQQEFSDGYDRGISSDKRGNVLKTRTSRHEAPATRSAKSQPQGSSTRSESSQRSKLGEYTKHSQEKRLVPQE